MSAYFWNSGPPPPAGGGGGTPPPSPWPGWGGMGGGAHGIQGVPGGAVPPTLNATGQALLAQMQQGPMYRGPMGTPTSWAQMLGLGAPAVSGGGNGLTSGGVAGAGAPNNPYGPVVVTPHGAGFSTSGMSHSPLSNPTGGGTATNMGPYPPGPTPNPPTQDGPNPNPPAIDPAVLSAWWQWWQNRRGINPTGPRGPY